MPSPGRLLPGLALLCACSADRCGKQDTDTSDTGAQDTALEPGPTCETPPTYDIANAESVLVQQDGWVGAGEYAGDVTGDGEADLLVHIERFNGTSVIVEPVELAPGVNPISTDTNTWFVGCSNALGCDLNGDGVEDVANGLQYSVDDMTIPEILGINYRMAYGPITPTSDGITWDIEFTYEEYSRVNELYPHCMGDMNGDGIDTLALEYWHNMDPVVYLHEGPISSMEDFLESSEAHYHAGDMGVAGVDTYSDLNADGLGDLVLGDKNEIMVLFGPFSDELTEADVDVSITSASIFIVSPLSDWNLDGYGELLLSSGEPWEGLYFIPDITVSGSMYDLATYQLTGGGAIVTEVPDANGDGRIEVLFGNSYGCEESTDDSENPGRAWLLDAPGEGVMSLEDAAVITYGSADGRRYSVGSGALSGFDFDLDGRPDLALESDMPTGVVSFISAAGL